MTGGREAERSLGRLRVSAAGPLSVVSGAPIVPTGVLALFMGRALAREGAGRSPSP